MRFKSLPLAIPLLFLGLYSKAEVRTVVVPAGTLMTCALDEPRFSSANVALGDPFLCYPRNLTQFGQPVFPRGTYIVGHLEADKDPGHFVGKGYLKLAFDRIGLPSGDVPITAKVVAVAGFSVDREGKIIGHGHATRDTVEWMLPPLWPWKVLTLPARGPRPALKNETRLTLRVMDDLVLPQMQTQTTSPGWHRFGEGSSSFPQPGPAFAPQSVSMELKALPAAPAVDHDVPRLMPVSQASNASSPIAPGSISAQEWGANVTLFALTDGTVLPVTRYRRDQGELLYESDGDKGTISLKSVDWSNTIALNAARNVRVTLRNMPSSGN